MRITDDIAIWGDHDEATIGQIVRCAADERVRGSGVARRRPQRLCDADRWRDRLPRRDLAERGRF